MNDEQDLPVQATPAQMRAIARRLILPHMFIVAAGVAASLWFVLYVMNGPRSKEAASEPAQCQVSRALAQKLAPLATGDLAALAIRSHPRPMENISFEHDGAPTDLAALNGRTILLNFWATWCAPCREEMPGLDRLQSLAGNPSFSVVAVNMDSARLDRPKTFLKQIGVKNLGFYADPHGKVFQTLQQAGKLVGLPTTLLIGPDGCEIGAMAGPAKWDGADAQALARAAAAK
ncbi:thiol:disulfide interchange protein TlpA [Rhodoblastus sp.]|uniref:thiol:disulfide interchange protein TlpA n=1 Tax=Rhodoblastus sp. TaxID=1962975 RepID=UPI003F9A3BC5